MEINNYEIVVFKRPVVLKNLYIGENKTINLQINKGEKVKLYFDKKDIESNRLYITAVRPVIDDIVLESINESSTQTLRLKNLWDGNFIFNNVKENVVNISNLPFEIKNYLEI